MLCPSCQTQNSNTAKFCNECGYDLRALNAEEPQAVEAAEVVEEAEAVEEEAPAEEVKPTEIIGDALGEVSSLRESVPLSVTVPPILPIEGHAGKESPAAETAHIPSVADEAQAMFGDTDAAKTHDLTGIEQLVDASYVPPAFSGRAGDTMELPRVEGEEAPASRQFVADADNAPETPERQKRSKGVIIALVVAVLVAAVAGATYYMEIWGGKSVPDVAGKTQAEAVSVLQQSGFAAAVEQVKSDDMEGIALSTDPASGQRAAAGATVTVHVATPRIIPQIVGLARGEAEELIAAEGFANVTYNLVKSNEAEGTVITVTPEQGAKATAGAEVIVEVAQPYIVPQVAGLSTKDAKAALEAEGYVVTIKHFNTEDEPEGTAMSTEPAAETKLNTGSEVVLYVAHNRSTELVDLTRAFLTKSTYMTIDGDTFKVNKDSIQLTYAGDNTVQFSLKATEVGFMFGIPVENPDGAQSISGSVTWTDDNKIASTKPSMKQGA